MVEPVGYDKLWQKFESEVYQLAREKLQSRFRVEWNHEIGGLKPDVVALLECSGCHYEREQEPCLIPSFIIEAYCKFKVERDYFQKKDEQMAKYSKICDSILVMPQGYEQRPYCRSKEGYHIVSFLYLQDLLDSIMSEAMITTHEEMCGNVPDCSARNVYKHFELTIRSRVDKCPECGSKVMPISLICCSQYDEYYHSDYLDFGEVEHGMTVPTYSECDGCGESRMFGWDYDECGHSRIEHKYLCENWEKCGAIFDPETRKVVTNFEDSHFMNLTSNGFYDALWHKRS